MHFPGQKLPSEATARLHIAGFKIGEADGFVEDVLTQFGLVRAFNAFNCYSINDAMEKSAVFVDFVNFEAAYLVRECSQKATVGGKPCSFKVHYSRTTDGLPSATVRSTNGLSRDPKAVSARGTQVASGAPPRPADFRLARRGALAAEPPPPPPPPAREASSAGRPAPGGMPASSTARMAKIPPQPPGEELSPCSRPRGPMPPAGPPPGAARAGPAPPAEPPNCKAKVHPKPRAKAKMMNGSTLLQAGAQLPAPRCRE